MSDAIMFGVPAGSRLTITPCSIYIRVIGENNEPGVSEALKRLDELHQELSRRGIPHRSMERKGNIELGDNIVDCIGFNTTR